MSSHATNRDGLIRSCAGLGLLGLAGLAVGSGPKPAPAPERPDMPYVAPKLPQRVSVPVDPRAPERAVPIFIKQVNTNGAGLNIVGDAANEPSIAVDPANPMHMAVGWRQFDTITSNFRQAGAAYSRDNGRTWTTVGPLAPGIFHSDPILRFAPDSKLFYNSLLVVGGSTFTDQYFVSLDGGATYAAPYNIPGGDKTWFVIDSTTSIGHGNHYDNWNVASNPTPGKTFARSITAGATWQTPLAMPGGPPIFGTPSIGPNGEVYFSGTNAAAPGLSVVRSTNAKDSSVTPTFAASFPPINGDLGFSLAINPDGLPGQLNSDVDRSSGPGRGFVYVCGSVVPSDTSDPLEVRFQRSRDGGVTWDPYVRVNDDVSTTAVQWFATMSVAPNGRIDVVWNDTRADPVNNMLSRTYYAFSTNNGASFSANQPITVQWDPAVGYPQQNKIGDYYDMHSDNVGADLIFAATFNGEEDVYYARIGEFDCNANGIADSVDISSGTSKDCNGDGIPDECQKACPGDTNGDGKTNTLDLGAVLSKFGQTVPLCDPANLNNDTVINTLDLGILLSNFGCGT